MRTLLLFLFLGSTISGFAQSSRFHSFKTQGADVNPAFNAHKEVAEVTYLTKIGPYRINHHLLQGSFAWKGMVLQSGLYGKYGANYENDRSMYLGVSKNFALGHSQLGIGVNARRNSPVENGRLDPYQWCGTREKPHKATVVDLGFTLKRGELIWAVSFNEIGLHTTDYPTYSRTVYPKSSTMSLFNTSHVSEIDLNYGVNVEWGQGANFLMTALLKEKIELGMGLMVTARQVDPFSPKASLGYRLKRVRLIYTYMHSKGHPSDFNEHELGITMSLYKKEGTAAFNMF